MVQVKAVIFGAIGVIAETSDLQRQSFNLAFQEHGLDWNWNPATYRRLLTINGGQARLRAYRDEDIARSNVSDTMIAALHDRKAQHYARLTATGAVQPRPGVAELMQACAAAGVKAALCTSTSVENVSALKIALGDSLNFDAFSSVMTIDKIAHVKPAPDAYLACLAELALTASEVVAIEDTPVSMQSALAAGIAVIATPGAMTNDQDFSNAALIVESLESLMLEQIDAVLARSSRYP